MASSGVRVRVPATSANLGPSYDCGGLALALYDELAAQVSLDGELTIEVSGEGADSVPRDESHLVVRAIARGFEQAGQMMPGLHLRCVNRIPHGRGLGSSSAAIVGGLMLARGLLAEGGDILDDRRLLALATEIEGHPDNVAPALLGGFTLAWSQKGIGRAIRLEPIPELVAVVAIPAQALSTARARELLPAAVPHRDAAFNAGRSALLVEALTRRPELLLTATEDRLHQDYRRFAYPQSHGLMVALRRQGFPAMISGAGPTVIAVTASKTDASVASIQAAMNAYAEAGGGSSFRMLSLAVDGDGAFLAAP